MLPFEGFIKIVFVKSEENLADGFMKNTMGSLYDAHTWWEFMAEREAFLLNGAGQVHPMLTRKGVGRHVPYVH